jgi:hypothetical protein
MAEILLAIAFEAVSETIFSSSEHVEEKKFSGEDEIG